MILIVWDMLNACVQNTNNDVLTNRSLTIGKSVGDLMTNTNTQLEINEYECTAARINTNT